MMTLAERLAMHSNSYESAQNDVSEEIVSYFREYIYSRKFEESLERQINAYAKGTRSYTFTLEFWKYSSGCSETNFRLASKVWKNPVGTGYEAIKYRGVNLYDVHRKVCYKIQLMALDALTDMGFKISVRDDEGWLHCYRKEITISW
jgi:hypothetical protein